MALPEGARPWDLIVRDGIAYVLLEAPGGDGRLVQVLASTDLIEWTEVLQFTAPTFARSFERLGDDFYFGLGCDVGNPEAWLQAELIPETGTLLRVQGARITLPQAGGGE